MQELFEINSYDRSSGSPNSFTVLLPNGLQDKKEFQLVSASIPMNLFNVTSLNNAVTYFEYATTKTASVTPGYYNTAQLCTALGAALTLVGPDVYTVTYDNTKKQTTISKASTFSLFYDSRSPILELLGFILNNTQSATASSQVSTLSPDLYPRNLYLQISELGNSQIRSTGFRSFTYCIPVITSDSTYNTVSVEMLGVQKIKLPRLGTQCFTVKVVDRKMQLVELKSDWSFILAAS